MVNFKMRIVYVAHDSQSRPITNPFEPILDRYKCTHRKRNVDDTWANL
jgi:hypothetical protein